MWKNIKHLAKAAGNIVAISYAETAYRLNQVSDSTESVTAKLEAKTEALRKSYEQNLADRKSGVIKPEVVSEESTPKDIVPVN